MLRCCDFYWTNKLDGMEGTESLKIHTGNKNSITRETRDNFEGGHLKRKENLTEDNKVIEMSDNKPQNNKFSELQCEKPDDGSEKNDGTKEELKNDECCSVSETLDVPTLDLSTKSGESIENDDVSFSEDNSVDNNTFNIINTENSESQEVSELTNDDSSPVPTDDKENGDEGDFRENEESDVPTHTEEDSDEELSCLEEEEEEEDEECEMTEASVDSVGDDSASASEDGEESDDERDFDNDSLEDGKNNVPSSLDEPTAHKPPPPSPKAVAPAKNSSPKPMSPKFRHRVRSFGKKDKSEFKIEIFESKRKPPENLGVPIPGDSQSKAPVEVKINEPPIKSINDGNLAWKQSGKPDCARTPEDPSPRSDIPTPDSAGNSQSVLLDVSQAIREESEESDRLSPMKSPQEETKEGPAARIGAGKWPVYSCLTHLIVSLDQLMEIPCMQSLGVSLVLQETTRRKMPKILLLFMFIFHGIFNICTTCGLCFWSVISLGDSEGKYPESRKGQPEEITRTK